MNDDPLRPAPVPNGMGRSDVDLTLEPGMNTVCVYTTNGENAVLPEARHCIEVAAILQ